MKRATFVQGSYYEGQNLWSASNGEMGTKISTMMLCEK